MIITRLTSLNRTILLFSVTEIAPYYNFRVTEIAPYLFKSNHNQIAH